MDVQALREAKFRRDVDAAQRDDGGPMVAGSGPHHGLPMAPGFSTSEIEALLLDRQERGREEGWAIGRAQAFQEAYRSFEVESARDAQAWVSATLELAELELVPVINAAKEATEKAHAARAGEAEAPSAALAAAASAEGALRDLRDRIAGLRESIERDGVSG